MPEVPQPVRSPADIPGQVCPKERPHASLLNKDQQVFPWSQGERGPTSPPHIPTSPVPHLPCPHLHLSSPASRMHWLAPGVPRDQCWHCSSQKEIDGLLINSNSAARPLPAVSFLSLS